MLYISRKEKIHNGHQGGEKYFTLWEPRNSVIHINLIFNGSKGFIAKINLQLN